MMFPAALPAFADVFDFLVSAPSPRQILAYEPPPHLQERLTQLLARNREELLSEAERQELDEYLTLDRFFAKLKLHACKKLLKSGLYPRTKPT
jgi:hypothetical protein